LRSVKVLSSHTESSNMPNWNTCM